jgi:hypothetical protein
MGADVVQEAGEVAPAEFVGTHGGKVEVCVGVDHAGEEDGGSAVESAVRTVG